MIETHRKSDVSPPTMGEVARLILEAQAAGEPIALSINGQGKLPVCDPQSIQQLYELVEQLETVEALRQSRRAVEAGAKTFSLDEVCQELQTKYGV